MNAKKQRLILYLITVTILSTIAVQFYWNYKNYQQNKQRVLNEIQISLDKAIDTYYTNLSKDNIITIVSPDHPTEIDSITEDKIITNFLTTAEKLRLQNNNLNSNFLLKTNPNNITSVTINSTMFAKDSTTHTPIYTEFSKDGKSGIHVSSNKNITRVQVFKGKKASDSIKMIEGIEAIYIALKNDTLDFVEIDSLLEVELQKKGINSLFTLQHKKNDTLIYAKKNNFLTISAHSAFFKPNEHVQLSFKNPTTEALKRSLTGIFLSLLLSVSIISSLFYLLHIINQQKELAVIKNDLISNITHEFKTPITTVSTALEAINTFNILDNKVKTKEYLSISSVQLKKLHLMVEKLLETASLDSEQLLLKKEPVNVVDLVDKITQKHKQITTDKTISFLSKIDNLIIDIDVFHFENAVSNLIDNAIKYGGDTIVIQLKITNNQLEIRVQDNGKGIKKDQQDKIFDQFYRIPKGNTHNVKGFGIGLYYSTKIIEKHGGNISVNSTPQQTVFKISTPIK